jgi:hypothetical protein
MGCAPWRRTMASGAERSEERVLVLAPLGRDAELTAKILSEAGITALQCSGARSVGRELALGAGAVLLAEEALTPESLAELLPALADQPAWSDVPLGCHRARRPLRRLGTTLARAR